MELNYYFDTTTLAQENLDEVALDAAMDKAFHAISARLPRNRPTFARFRQNAVFQYQKGFNRYLIYGL